MLFWLGVYVVVVGCVLVCCLCVVLDCWLFKLVLLVCCCLFVLVGCLFVCFVCVDLICLCLFGCITVLWFVCWVVGYLLSCGLCYCSVCCLLFCDLLLAFVGLIMLF